MSSIRINDRASRNSYIDCENTGSEDDPYVIQTGISGVGVTNGGLDVSVQDPTTDTLILPLVYQTGTTALSVEAVPNQNYMEVDSNSGMTIGDHIRIINIMGDRYYNGTILDIIGTSIYLDNLIDYPYEVDSEVTWGDINMAVNGSVTPVHFHLRTGAPSIPSSIDITRMIMVCECNGAVDLHKFGDIVGGLYKGLTFRMTNGFIRNIWNVKTNSDLASLAYDWTPYAATNPAQGVDGFSWRLTFGGQSKVGVVIRIDQDGQLGIIVQDDLTDLVRLTVMVEGHVTSE